MSQGILFHQSKEGIFVYVHISESEKKAANKINCDLVPLVRIISWLPTRGRWRLFIKRKWWKYLSLLSNFSWSFHTPAPLGRTKHNSTSQVNHIFSFQVSSHCYFSMEREGDFATMTPPAERQESSPEGLYSIQCRVYYLQVLEKLQMEGFKTPIGYFLKESFNGTLYLIWLNPVIQNLVPPLGHVPCQVKSPWVMCSPWMLWCTKFNMTM